MQFLRIDVQCPTVLSLEPGDVERFTKIGMLKTDDTWCGSDDRSQLVWTDHFARIGREVRPYSVFDPCTFVRNCFISYRF